MTGSPISPPIFVVDRHGDALQYWLAARQPAELVTRGHDTSKPFSVLHFDSHADMHIDWADDSLIPPGPAWRPPLLKDLQVRVLSEINIANFQPAAVFAGLVDSIVWVRSDFELGKYNSPPPGHYRQLIGVPDYSKPDTRPDLGVLPEQLSGGGRWSRPLLCLWELDAGEGGGAFHEYGEYVPHEFRRQVRGIRRHGVPLEKNTAWEDVPKHWLSGRPPAPGLSMEFDQTVVTTTQLEAPGALEDLQSRLHVGANGSTWILDIDLDFFATFSPSLAGPIERHGWTSAECSTSFANWSVRLRTIVSNGLEPACQADLFNPITFQQYTAREITQLVWLPSAQKQELTGSELLQRFQQIVPTCEPPLLILDALAQLVNNLTHEQRIQWQTLDGEDWHRVMQPHGPHHFASCREIRADVKRMEPLLKGMPYPPTLVTVARSSDMYLPAEAAAAVEWEVLMLIKRVWPCEACGRVPPATLEECNSEDLALALRGVEFHASLPGVRLQPQPWPLPTLPCFTLPGNAMDAGFTGIPIPVEPTGFANCREYALVGSWDCWAGFHDLLREDTSGTVFSASVQIPAHMDIEFQILCGRDWDQRFFPSSSSCAILGPRADAHGRNWRLEAAHTPTILKVAWDPTGKKCIRYGLECHSGSSSLLTPLAVSQCALVSAMPDVFEPVD